MRHVLNPTPFQKDRQHGSLDVENSLVDIDYTSQINKDIDKRRSFLFQLILIDNTEYIFQASSEKNRTAWWGHVIGMWSAGICHVFWFVSEFGESHLLVYNYGCVYGHMIFMWYAHVYRVMAMKQASRRVLSDEIEGGKHKAHNLSLTCIIHGRAKLVNTLNFDDWKVSF